MGPQNWDHFSIFFKWVAIMIKELEINFFMVLIRRWQEVRGEAAIFFQNI